MYPAPATSYPAPCFPLGVLGLSPQGLQHWSSSLYFRLLSRLGRPPFASFQALERFLGPAALDTEGVPAVAGHLVRERILARQEFER